MTPAETEALRRRLVDLGSATLYEAAGQVGALPSYITRNGPGQTVCGRVFTVSMAPGDNLRLHQAMYACDRGDVLVVETGGGLEHGYFGEVMARAAIARDLGGLVIDGGVRDGDRIAALDFPVFAARRCIRGTTKRHDGGGGLGGLISIGDVEVRTGDIVVGDGDGVVILSADALAQTLADAEQRETKEQRLFDRIALGETTLSLLGLES